MPILAPNIPVNSAKVREEWRLFAALIGPGEVVSRQFDFSGGRGSVISGIGTVKLGFFVSCENTNIKYHLIRRKNTT